MISSPQRKTSEQQQQQRSKLDARIQRIVEVSQHSQIDSVYDDAYKFKLSLCGFEKCRLSMKNNGSYLFQLREATTPATDPPSSSVCNQEEGDEVEQPEQQHPRLMPNTGSSIKYNLFLKVRTLYGRTKIILSSPLLVENNTKVKLHVLIELNDRVAHWCGLLKRELSRYEEISVANFGGGPTEDPRRFALIFELLPGKVYYVPLVVAYNFKIYVTPNVSKHQPALVFDIRGYNLRIDDTSEVCCKRRVLDESGAAKPSASSSSSTAATDPLRVVTETTDESDESAVVDNDFYLIKQLSLNVRSHKNVMPAMHANYKVIFLI